MNTHTQESPPIEVLFMRAGFLKPLSRSTALVDAGTPRPRRPLAACEATVKRGTRQILSWGRHRSWNNASLREAIDPTGEANQRDLARLIAEHAPRVARSIGMAVVENGDGETRYVPPATAERDYGVRQVRDYEALVETLLRENPRPWTMAEIKARIWPNETARQHVRHTHIHVVVDKVLDRAGFAKIRDPHHRKRVIIAPRGIAQALLRATQRNVEEAAS